MMSMLGFVLLGLAAMWACGGSVLRVGGSVIALAGALALVVTGSPGGLMLVICGGCLRVTGRLYLRSRPGGAGVR